MLRLRSGSLALVCAVVAHAACSQSQPTASTTRKVNTAGPVELAAFTGRFDPTTRKLTFETSKTSDPNALTVLLPYFDGAPGSPDNTFEMLTLDAENDATGCGGSGSSWGTIRLQSYFTNQQMQNVWVEITDVDTGHEACNSDSSAPVGLSAANGLWSYGTLGVKGSLAPLDVSDHRWEFRDAGQTPFTFHGRVMGTLSAPAAPTGNIGFNWTPTSLVNPPRSFQLQAGTTVAHIVWNDTLHRFEDTVTGTTFSLHTGGSYATVTPYLDDPPQPYVTFPSSSYWVEDPDTDTSPVNPSHFDLSGDFTACAKIKPGVLPDHGFIKTLFAKGDPMAYEGTYRLGFALMEMSGEFCFHYRSPDDNTLVRGERMSPVTVGDPADVWTYAYICGGRAGGWLTVGGHGMLINSWYNDETGNYDGHQLPLAIGAMADGLEPAQDAGLYEVIIDNRPMSLVTMQDIINRAEGRVLPGAASAIYQETRATQTTVPGADGAGYVLPPYTTLPISTDGSGLLDAGKVVTYTHPLSADTRTTGFCMGATVDADAAWSTVTGTILSFDETAYAPDLVTVLGDGWVRLESNPIKWYANYFAASTNPPFNPNSWADGSEHTILVCGVPGTPNTLSLYLDGAGAPVASGTTPNPLPNLSAPTSNSASPYNFVIGGIVQGMWTPPGTVPLTGARIRRVWACATSNPATCP